MKIKKFKVVAGKRLTEKQRLDLELSIYSQHDYWPKDSPFRDVDDRQKKWFEFRDVILKDWSNFGMRPAAWFDYECKPEDRPQVVKEIPFDGSAVCYHTGRPISHHKIYEDDRIALKRAGLLTQKEVQFFKKHDVVRPE